MSPIYLLDTNICIYITKKKPFSVFKPFAALRTGDVAMSIITYGELLYGAEKSRNKKQASAHLETLIHDIPALPLSIDVGSCYGNIRAHLAKQGIPMVANDLWIAAHAVALHVILVTNNEREFSRVHGLQVENWLHPGT